MKLASLEAQLVTRKATAVAGCGACKEIQNEAVPSGFIEKANGPCSVVLSVQGEPKHRRLAYSRIRHSGSYSSRDLFV